MLDAPLVGSAQVVCDCRRRRMGKVALRSVEPNKAIGFGVVG